MAEVFGIIVPLACVFGLGMSFALLGSISVKLMPRVSIDQGKFGTMISAFMFTCLLASLVTGVVVDSIGYMPVAIVGFVATAACIFLLAAAKTFSASLVACLLLGIGAMALNTVGNTLIPQVLFDGKDPAAASNLGNVFFGLGLFVTPLIVSFLFRKTTYEKAVGALGVIVLIPVIFTFLAGYPDVKAGFAISKALSLLAEPAVLVAAFALFCYISLESSFCNWIPPFGKEVITKEKPEGDEAVADASAQRMLSVFAIMMMIGRFIASQVPGITGVGGWVIAGAALAAGLIILAMTVAKTSSIAYVLAGLAGLAFAPCFPTTVGVTFAKFQPEIYGSIFGIIFAVGLAGAVIMPKAIGNMAKGSSVQKSLKLLAPLCVILIVLAIALGYIKGSN